MEWLENETARVDNARRALSGTMHRQALQTMRSRIAVPPRLMRSSVRAIEGAQKTMNGLKRPMSAGTLKHELNVTLL